MSQLQADLTPERAAYLQEHGEVLSIEAVEHVAKIVGSDSAAQKLLDEIKANAHEELEPVVILDQKTNALILVWGKK